MIFKENDSLLRGNIFNFSVDNLERIGDNLYNALLIPDINSKYFPPFHTRSIKISRKLLKYEFFRDQFPKEEVSEQDFFEDIQQGGYYSIPTEILKTLNKEKDVRDDVIEERFFKQYFNEDSTNKKNVDGDKNLPVNDAQKEINEIPNGKLKGLILYCFNVGQGDFNLLITSNGNPFIIDTNIYYEQSLYSYIEKIKVILKSHELNENNIKGLIITHQHIDHIRGADQLLDSGAFNFEFFIINKDYNHSTRAVSNLYNSAKRIPNCINSCNTWDFHDGNSHICIKNPDEITKNAFDINNSSISICISDNDNLFYLTGDTGFHVLEKCYNCIDLSQKDKSMLKVSHHGSRTGTSDSYLKLIKPDFAFVSAGHSKKYKHPHNEAINALRHNRIEYDISKYINESAIYTSFPGSIRKELRII